jgi:F-type H+-transporting ATPase subunit alpha
MILYGATNGYLDDVPLDKIRSFESNFLRYMEASHPDIGRSISETKDIGGETETALKRAIEDFKRTGSY